MLLMDIGGWTVGLMRLDNGIPNASTCRSLELGMIRCIDEAKEQVRRETGLSVTDAQVERVLAGQEISRKKGVLYGNGNILGYRLVRNINEDGKWNPEENTYKIEPEQAETVQMIYDMCCDGMGYLQISKELERRKRKDGAGNVSWCSSKIG